MPETVVTRRCNICNENKPLDEFVRDKSKKFGRGYRCFSCNRTQCNAAYIPKKKKWNRNWKRPTSDKVSARMAIQYAVRVGKITKETNCFYCGSTERVQAHHHLGYEKEHRLDVLWLCNKCHAFIHRKPLEILDRMPSPLWDLLRKV